MNREIKFQVIERNEIIGIERLRGTQWQWQYFLLNPDKGERWNNGVFGNSTDLIRRQFTGLKDKDGKEIYEHDIVRLINSPDQEGADHMKGVGVVKFCTESLQYKTFKEDGFSPMLAWTGYESIEIIGNVYETPEKLK